MDAPDITVVILTLNEERNLPLCLESLRPLKSRIFVVDSGSSDGTLEIARAEGCEVLFHSFETHAKQWAWAIDSLPREAEWVLGLDADQRISAELCESIQRFISSSPGEGGAFLNRRQVFRGRWIRHGGYYPKFLLKLFRRDRVQVGHDLVDHHFIVSGSTVNLEGDLIEANLNEDEISTWIAKHNRYAVLQATDELDDLRERPRGRLFGDPDDRTAVLKSVWRRLPHYVRPAAYFFYRYVLRLGFLDGKEGFVFHFLQTFWYRLLVDINMEEQQRKPRSEHSA